LENGSMAATIALGWFNRTFTIASPAQLVFRRFWRVIGEEKMKRQHIAYLLVANVVIVLLGVESTSASVLSYGSLIPSRQAADKHEVVHDENHQASSKAETAPAIPGVAPNDSWPMAGANPQRTSWTPEEVRGRLEPIWYRPIEPYILPRVQIIAANGLLYVSTAKGLYALGAETGDVAWVYPTELPLGHSPTIHNGVAYVGGFDHKIHAIDALTGQGKWTFEAEKGFQTNPLLVGDKVYAGNRDGNMYAIYTSGPQVGQLAWKYRTDGPVLYSAAYKDGVIYFASNDSHAYALDADDGSLVWKSDKLPGSGFHSWWPVVHTDPQTLKDYVILAGSNNYRRTVEPGPKSDIQGLEIADLYVANGIPDGETIAPISPDGSMDVTKILEYYEQKPWRRTYFVLNADNGQEYTFGYRRGDGTTGTSYAPMTWLHTHGPGNRYPPVVGSDGRLYQPVHYISNTYIPRGSIVGWELGSSSIHIPESWKNAMDEPMAYASGGDLIYWVRCCDRVGAAFDMQQSNEWIYWSYYLEDWMPGYNELFLDLCGTNEYITYQGDSDSVNGVYGCHGEQNPLIPYDGKVYAHRSNSIIAFGDDSGSPVGLPMAGAVEVDNADIAPVSTEQLERQLSEEVQGILDAGHLRPGYLGSGLFDQRSLQNAGEYLLDYWHHPSDVLYILSLALPHLPESQQDAVRTYLQSEYAAYPPYEYTHIGWREGASRQAFDLPPEVESDRDAFPAKAEWHGFYSGWQFPPHMFYGLWKYAEAVGNARQVFDQNRDRLEPPPSNSYLAENPQVHNAYIAGYLGYLELESLAGYPESSDVRAELDRLLSLRATTFSKDTPWLDCRDYRRTLNVARNFMYLVPELGDYLGNNASGRVEAAIDEYVYVAPYWFVAKTENQFYEGVMNPLYDLNALFQAKALILGESREELIKYLDVPAFERGDLFHIQNLITTIEAPHSLEKVAHPNSGGEGDTINYSLSFFGSDSTLSLTDTLPAGLSAPGSFELHGTSVTPTYDSDRHRLTWSDTPGLGTPVLITYTATVMTRKSQALVNVVELSETGAEPIRRTLTVIANPHRIYLPLVLRDE
jgi:hypothetical protein